MGYILFLILQSTKKNQIFPWFVNSYINERFQECKRLWTKQRKSLPCKKCTLHLNCKQLDVYVAI